MKETAQRKNPVLNSVQPRTTMYSELNDNRFLLLLLLLLSVKRRLNSGNVRYHSAQNLCLLVCCLKT
jgi:hypothetical protein